MTPSEKSLEEKLNDHPKMKKFVVSLLEIVDSSQYTAHEVEEVLVKKRREYESGILEEWAKKKR